MVFLGDFIYTLSHFLALSLAQRGFNPFDNFSLRKRITNPQRKAKYYSINQVPCDSYIITT